MLYCSEADPGEDFGQVSAAHAGRTSPPSGGRLTVPGKRPAAGKLEETFVSLRQNVGMVFGRPGLGQVVGCAGELRPMGMAGPFNQWR